jgi:hypothetical protein
MVAPPVASAVGGKTQDKSRKDSALLRRFALPAIVAGALAFPAAASAGTLTTPHVCWEQGQDALISGTGFTPMLSLPFTGEQGESSAAPDENGAFTDTRVGMPDYTSYKPRNVTIVTHDQVTPANDTSIALMEVKFGSNLPVSGKHAQIVTWQFAGFPTGSTLYVHFRRGFNGPLKKIKDIKVGKAAGPCGTFTKKMMRVPVKNPSRKGDWYVQVDTHPKYSSSTNTFFWYKSFNLR